ncbi:hypothetical protein PINS_up009983 [Pythium insidiosum]|nr:hypothetical protein PINS_up009983 [Pythium insidiosum]
MNIGHHTNTNMPKSKKKTSAKKPSINATASSSLEAVLRAANGVRDVMTDFAAFSTFQRNGLDASVVNRHSAALSTAQRDAIFALFEHNMKDMYRDSDWGYDAHAKRQELFEDDARYLLVTRRQPATTTGTAHEQEDDEELLGFVHFRFFEDDGAPVLYVYEIQIAAAAQRKGLGKFLMQLLQLVARRQRMELVVLTVFKANVAAMAFYLNTMKFVVDETSPSACGDDSQSYEILSKAV